MTARKRMDLMNWLVRVLSFLIVFIAPILLFFFLSQQKPPYCVSAQQAATSPDNWSVPIDKFKTDLNRLTLLDGRLKPLLYDASFENSISFDLTVVDESGVELSRDNAKAGFICTTDGGVTKQIDPGASILGNSQTFDEISEKLSRYNTCNNVHPKIENPIYQPASTTLNILMPQGNLCLSIKPTLLSKLAASLISFGAIIGLLLLLREGIKIVRGGKNFFWEKKHKKIRSTSK